MILNENIHEFDNVEKQETKKHSIKDYFKRIKLIVDEKLFETTYQEEFEVLNKRISMLQSQLIVTQRHLKHVHREKRKLEKRLSKYE